MIEGRLNVTLGLGIECRCCFVEDEDRRVLQDGARDRQTLTLSTREQYAIFPDEGVESGREAVDEFLGVGGFSRCFDAISRRIGQVTVGDVVGDGIVEQGNLLGDQCDVLPEVS